jgi:(p)ppGpp synthase/HD superfamily hydrolase
MPNKLAIAKKIAQRVHGHQVDKKDYPYLAHVYDVAQRVNEYGKNHYIVGLLHDAIEDSCNISAEFQQEIINEIKLNFDLEIYDAIMAITKLKPPLRETKEDYLSEYLPRLKKNPIAVKVKIADSSHNLSKAHLIEDRVKQGELRQKYINVLDSLGIDGKKQEKQIIFKNGKWIEKK